MPVRHPILNGFGRLGLGEAAAKMIDASVDTIVKEQDEFKPEGFREFMKARCGDILTKPILDFLHWD